MGTVATISFSSILVDVYLIIHAPSGGLDDVKEMLRQCITYPLKYPRLYQVRWWLLLLIPLAYSGLVTERIIVRIA